jgi:hypothetical protein
LQPWLSHSLNIITQERASSIDDAFQDLMVGVKNLKNMTIVDLLPSKDFIGQDPYLQTCLREREEQYLFAVAANAAWRFDRVYINWSDSPNGCLSESRGRSNYLICLPEHPYQSFWLYAVGQGRENDFVKNDQAQVTGPSGFHRLNKKMVESYNITREDVVRDSLFVHRHKLDDAIDGLNVPKIASALLKEGVELPSLDHDWVSGPPMEHLDKVLGAFSVPICCIPGGESISSVWEDKIRNYPCMCGKFTWNKEWTEEKDETLRFLEHERREKDNPPIPGKLKHPFKQCKKVNKHDYCGRPEKDQQMLRNLLHLDCMSGPTR